MQDRCTLKKSQFFVLHTRTESDLIYICRIAANEPSFLSSQLKVLDQRDKQKLNIKALDVVLFGPPTRKNCSLLSSFLIFSFSLSLSAPSLNECLDFSKDSTTIPTHGQLILSFTTYYCAFPFYNRPPS